MKTETLTVLGVKVTYQRASSSEETNRLANIVKDGQLVDVANDRCWRYTNYHQLYGDLRKAATAFVVAKKFTCPEAGLVTPKTKSEKKTAKDGTVKEVITVDESDETFIKRAIALGATTPEELQQHLQECCNNPEWSYAEYLKETTRHVTPKGPSKDSQATVKAWADAGVTAEKVASLSAKIRQPIDATDPTAIATALDTFKHNIAKDAIERAKQAKRDADAAAQAL